MTENQEQAQDASNSTNAGEPSSRPEQQSEGAPPSADPKPQYAPPPKRKRKKAVEIGALVVAIVSLFIAGWAFFHDLATEQKTWESERPELDVLNARILSDDSLLEARVTNRGGRPAEDLRVWIVFFKGEEITALESVWTYLDVFFGAEYILTTPLPRTEESRQHVRIYLIASDPADWDAKSKSNKVYMKSFDFTLDYTNPEKTISASASLSEFMTQIESRTPDFEDGIEKAQDYAVDQRSWEDRRPELIDNPEIRIVKSE